MVVKSVEMATVLVVMVVQMVVIAEVIDLLLMMSKRMTQTIRTVATAIQENRNKPKRT